MTHSQGQPIFIYTMASLNEQRHKISSQTKFEVLNVKETDPTLSVQSLCMNHEI